MKELKKEDPGDQRWTLKGEWSLQVGGLNQSSPLILPQQLNNQPFNALTVDP